MSEPMVRKQIYLPRRQDALLKKLASQRGVSKAEVIRQALEHEAQTPAPAAQGIRFVNPFLDTFDINEWV